MPNILSTLSIQKLNWITVLLSAYTYSLKFLFIDLEVGIHPSISAENTFFSLLAPYLLGFTSKNFFHLIRSFAISISPTTLYLLIYFMFIAAKKPDTGFLLAACVIITMSFLLVTFGGFLVKAALFRLNRLQTGPRAKLVYSIAVIVIGALVSPKVSGFIGSL